MELPPWLRLPALAYELTDFASHLLSKGFL